VGGQQRLRRRLACSSAVLNSCIFEGNQALSQGNPRATSRAAAASTAERSSPATACSSTTPPWPTSWSSIGARAAARPRRPGPSSRGARSAGTRPRRPGQPSTSAMRSGHGREHDHRLLRALRGGGLLERDDPTPVLLRCLWEHIGGLDGLHRRQAGQNGELLGRSALLPAGQCNYRIDA